ncbi:type IV pilus biogenesis protein PilM [Caproiciproducens faecalis]|uniref:Competence protein A n=1 Tax=Caproiciproducens faecalis TaxID=2820301 RepID=A0ABS7DK07_9FIRM|nr:hypothetical protein [Caproiciproducens faecalis]MBW7571553.1 hypothetical protein [Caproiciproducens faecalis]
MNVILLQTTRSALYLTWVKYTRKPVFGLPQCFELPESMRDGKECNDLPAFARYVQECAKSVKMGTNKIIYCLEDDHIISKEYQHLPCKKKDLLKLAELEAETVLQDGVDEYMIQNYEYNRVNPMTGKLTSSLFAVKTKLLGEIRKNFSKYGLHVIKIVPPISGLLHAGKKIPAERNQTIALLDFDYTKTRLVLFQNGMPVFQRTFETVFDDIVEIIMRNRSVSFADAVRSVTAYGFTVENDETAAQQISDLLDACVSEAIRNIRMVLSSERLELNRLILCGGLSIVPKFDEFCAKLELDIPIENVASCSVPQPALNAAAKRAGFQPSAFYSEAGLLSAKKSEDIDFLLLVKAISSTHAANVAVLVLITLLAVGVMALEPIVYLSALKQQAQDNSSLNGSKYEAVKDLLQEQSELEQRLSKLKNDQKLLPSGKSNAKEMTGQLISQITAKAKSVDSCDLDNMTGTVALTFTTANYNGYLTIKNQVESNGYFSIAVPFRVDIGTDGGCTCSVSLKVKDFTPSVSGGKEGGQQ